MAKEPSKQSPEPSARASGKQSARGSSGSTEAKVKKQGRISQIRDTYRMAKKRDRWIGYIAIGAGLAVWAAFIGLGFLILNPWVTGIFGFTAGFLVATIIFGRRAERAAYAQVDGQVGAAAAVMNSLRRGWLVTPAVAVTRNQDVVHRAIGRCGIVLVGEGVPARVGNLLGTEKKRHSRVAPAVEVYTVIVGEGEGQVALKDLNRHLTKLPRRISDADVTDINFRLKAVQSQPVPIPKGPLPMNTKVSRSAKLR